MSDRDEWDFPNDATPPGSGPYYVVRFSNPADYNRLARWYAWFEHIDRIALKANDPGAARLKLDWWREEAQLVQQDSARHPLAQALVPQVGDQWQVMQMQRTLDTVERRILRQQPRDTAELQQHCRDRQASRLRLLSNSDTQQEVAELEKLGAFVGLVERLAQLAQDIHDNYLSLPGEVFSKHGVTVEALRGRAPLPELAALSEDLLGGVALSSAEMTRLRQQPALRPALRSVAQYRRLTRSMARHGYASHRRCFTLSPLGLLWSAKRMR